VSRRWLTGPDRGSFVCHIIANGEHEIERGLFENSADDFGRRPAVS
jgi:hypothetical protein